MIASIKHKGLKLLWTRGNGSRLPADQLVKIKEILLIIDAAEEIDNMDIPGFRLHPLKGNLAGFWAVVVKANWRIIFEFENGNAYLLDYLDYH